MNIAGLPMPEMTAAPDGGKGPAGLNLSDVLQSDNGGDFKAKLMAFVSKMTSPVSIVTEVLTPETEQTDLPELMPVLSGADEFAIDDVISKDSDMIFDAELSGGDLKNNIKSFVEEDGLNNDGPEMSDVEKTNNKTGFDAENNGDITQSLSKSIREIATRAQTELEQHLNKPIDYSLEAATDNRKTVLDASIQMEPSRNDSKGNSIAQDAIALSQPHTADVFTVAPSVQDASQLLASSIAVQSMGAKTESINPINPATLSVNVNNPPVNQKLAAGDLTDNGRLILDSAQTLQTNLTTDVSILKTDVMDTNTDVAASLETSVKSNFGFDNSVAQVIEQDTKTNINRLKPTIDEYGLKDNIGQLNNNIIKQNSEIKPEQLLTAQATLKPVDNPQKVATDSQQAKGVLTAPQDLSQKVQAPVNGLAASKVNQGQPNINLTEIVPEPASGNDDFNNLMTRLSENSPQPLPANTGELASHTELNLPDSASAEVDVSVQPANVSSSSGAKVAASFNEAVGHGNPRQDAAGVNTQNTSDAIINAVKTGKNEITLNLNPGDLGQLKVQLNSSGPQQINARFITANVDAFDEISNQLKQLKTSLETQGLQLDKVQVMVAGEAMNSDLSQSFSEQKNQSDSASQQSSWEQSGASSQNQYSQAEQFFKQFDQQTSHQQDRSPLNEGSKAVVENDTLVEGIREQLERETDNRRLNPNGSISVLV